ncbi:MAG: ABC transporter substrate-binding protein, partial [Acidobacteriota bacterium]|nr:ABC transporter substrate-binding protein [Acidobacteriota bacterium]
MARGGPGAALGRQWRRLRRRSAGAQVATLVVVLAVVGAVVYAVASGSSPAHGGSGRAAATGTSIPTGTPSGIGVDQASTSTRGITKTTINVAFPISNLTSLASNFGFAGDAEYAAQKKAINTYVNAVNAGGGINGRRINPMIVNIDPTNEASMRAQCKQWTEGSPPVFAVLDGVGSWTGDNELCVAQEGQTPLIGEWTTVTNWTQEGSPYLWWLGPDQADILATVVSWGASSGLLGGGRKVAVVAGDRQSDQIALQDYLLPDFAKAGLPAPMVETIPTNTSDSAALNSAAPVIVQRLKAAGVDSVVPLMPFNSFFVYLAQETSQN